MAGHSPFKNIMHRKKAVDAKRSRAFSKHARLIMSAVRTGGGDPAMNLSLRYAIDRSREDNMTNEAIERAIKAALGKADAGALETLTYEGYGPGGVAILIDALTDNRARTFGEVRLAVEHNGGSLGAAGSVSWNFERRGLFFVPAAPEKEEALLEVAMNAEADDCSGSEGGFGVTCDPTRFAQVKQALVDGGFQPSKSEIAWVPKAAVTLTDEQVVALVALTEALEELDDVQGTATNLEWTDAALAAADKA
ncbi:MAG TPA: YebC/PmpR family DNA-binding transcriptional regulator [Planctomycetota bacterium]|nr:YebC/PmpR family DNA-binding transcriptional regulator [Planctomycetota bacterium]